MSVSDHRCLKVRCIRNFRNATFTFLNELLLTVMSVTQRGSIYAKGLKYIYYYFALK